MGLFIDLNLSPHSQTMTTSYFLKLELHFNPTPRTPSNTFPLAAAVFHKAAQTSWFDPTHWEPQPNTAPCPRELGSTDTAQVRRDARALLSALNKQN